MNPKIKKVSEKLRTWSTVASKGMTSKKNKKRDVVLIGIYFATLIFFIFVAKINVFQNNQLPKEFVEPEKMLSEEQIYQEVKAVQETVDTTGWKAYKSQWYGIELKYPENWLPPKVQAAPRDVKWEYSYQFRKKTMEENDLYVGFDVVIYNLTKIKELTDTAEFPAIKNEELKAVGGCDSVIGHLIETGDYPAEEIYFPSTDDCYNPALFFSFTKDQYIYNFVPRTKEGIVMTNDPRVEMVDNFPEFFAAVSTWNIIDIVRARPLVEKPRISAPKPIAAVNGSGYGGMTCAKKNDHPGKSNQNKGRHLDMECCLDPDEIPNPWCNYSSAKYQKYLK